MREDLVPEKKKGEMYYSNVPLQPLFKQNERIYLVALGIILLLFHFFVLILNSSTLRG